MIKGAKLLLAFRSMSQTSKQKKEIRLGKEHLQCSSTKGEGALCMFVEP